MEELRTFKGFLSSLAPLSKTVYQIWGIDGEMVFSTADPWSQAPSMSELQAFSNRVIDREDFQYAPFNGDQYVCGIPLGNGSGIVGSLIAFDASADKAKPTPGAHAPYPSQVKDMERFLVHLGTLMNESLTAGDEIVEMAQELGSNFESLNLYSRIANQLRTLKFSGIAMKGLIEELQVTMRAEMAFAVFPERPEYNFCTGGENISQHVTQAEETFVESLLHRIPLDAPTLEEGYFIVNDSTESVPYGHLASTPYRFLTVKVQHKEAFYGWLGLVSFNLDEIFRQGELKLLLSMSEQIGVMIANTDLYDDLEQFMVNMVKSLVFAIEAKDAYIRGHSERVSHYCELVGKRLSLSEKECSDLKWASILHDIGKIGIPESILNKPEPLSEAEFEIIKEHPRKGGEILRPVGQLLSALPGIIYHHERFDGQGYPQGLKAEEIPLAARIIAVADTFDAINSNRAYRAARCQEETLEIMEAVSGSQLDPRLVQLFKEMCQEGVIKGKEKENER